MFRVRGTELGQFRISLAYDAFRSLVSQSEVEGMSLGFGTEVWVRTGWFRSQQHPPQARMIAPPLPGGPCSVREHSVSGQSLDESLKGRQSFQMILESELCT